VREEKRGKEREREGKRGNERRRETGKWHYSGHGLKDVPCGKVPIVPTVPMVACGMWHVACLMAAQFPSCKRILFIYLFHKFPSAIIKCTEK